MMSKITNSQSRSDLKKGKEKATSSVEATLPKSDFENNWVLEKQLKCVKIGEAYLAIYIREN